MAGSPCREPISSAQIELRCSIADHRLLTVLSANAIPELCLNRAFTQSLLSDNLVDYKKKKKRSFQYTLMVSYLPPFWALRPGIHPHQSEGCGCGHTLQRVSAIPFKWKFRRGLPSESFIPTNIWMIFCNAMRPSKALLKDHKAIHHSAEGLCAGFMAASQTCLERVDT